MEKCVYAHHNVIMRIKTIITKNLSVHMIVRAFRMMMIIIMGRSAKKKRSGKRVENK